MKYLCLILLLLLPFEMKAQSITDSAEVVMYSSIDIKHQKKLYKQTKYWERYKTLKAIGWCMFGVGTLGTAFCLVGKDVDLYLGHQEDYNFKKKMWNALICTGGVIMAGSIPVLVFAYRNRALAKKSVRLSPACSCIRVDLPTGCSEIVPAVGVNLTF